MSHHHKETQCYNADHLWIKSLLKMTVFDSFRTASRRELTNLYEMTLLTLLLQTDTLSHFMYNRLYGTHFGIMQFTAIRQKIERNPSILQILGSHASGLLTESTSIGANGSWQVLGWWSKNQYESVQPVYESVWMSTNHHEPISLISIWIHSYVVIKKETSLRWLRF